MASLHIDCSTCVARDVACADCVVSVLLHAPSGVQLTAQEQAALQALADSGLVPPLRHESARPQPLRLIRGVREGRGIAPPAPREESG